MAARGKEYSLLFAGYKERRGHLDPCMHAHPHPHDTPPTHRATHQCPTPISLHTFIPAHTYDMENGGEQDRQVVISWRRHINR